MEPFWPNLESIEPKSWGDFAILAAVMFWVGFNRISNFLFGGVLGWIGGAGPRSFGVTLFMITIVPVMIFCGPTLLNLNGFVFGMSNTELLTYLVFGALGSIAATSVAYFPMLGARRHRRENKRLMELLR